MQKWFWGGAICLVCISASVVHASEDQQIARVTREEILFTKIPVVTAAKKVQQSSEAPAAITVITAEQIKDSGARTIAEAIQYVAGLNVFGFQGVDIRGVGTGGRVLLLVDGRRNNAVFTGGFDIGFERSVEKVKRIEIIKGPASSLYGTNAFAGIINIITKNGADQPGIVAQADGGNFSTQDYRLTWGRVGKSTDSFVSFYGHSDEGTNVQAPNDATRDADLFGKLSWKNFTFSAVYRPNRTEIPAVGGLLTPDAFFKQFNSYGQVQYERQFQGKWTLFSQFYVQHERLFLHGLRDLDVTDLRAEGEGRANYKFSDRDDITFGTELRHDHTDNELPNGTAVYSSANRSVYAENEFHFNPRFILTTGVRWDNNSIFGDSVNPRAGLIVNVSQDTNLKFFAGRAFRGPEFLDLFSPVLIGVFFIQPNPDLKPETVRSLEAEISHVLTKSIRLRVNVYHNSLHNLINITLKDRIATFANLGRASAYGLESGIEGKLADNVEFSVNHALQFARDNVSDLDLVTIPRNTVNATISYHSPNGFRIGFYNKFVDSRPAINALTGKRFELDPYFKSDLILSLNLPAHLELQTGVYNLFGVDYFSDFASPQRGVQVLVGITYHTK